MRFALVNLENFYEKQGLTHRFTMVKCAAIDSFQGGSKKVMVNDYTASEKLSLLSKGGRTCILLTRAEDYAVYVGNKNITGNSEVSTVSRPSFITPTNGWFLLTSWWGSQDVLPILFAPSQFSRFKEFIWTSIARIREKFSQLKV